MGITLVMTNSRGGIISVVAEILFFMIVTAVWRRPDGDLSLKSSRLRNAAVRIGLGAALMVGLFVGVILLGGEMSLSRFIDTVNTDDPTTGRAHFWSVTLEIIKANPCVGTGLGAFGVIYTRYDSRNGLFRLEQAHNDYLQVLSDGGIVGAGLGLFFIIALFRMGLARRETQDEFRRGVATGAL